MRTLCVIPARLASSRLPHKPLQRIANQPLIRVVAQRALDLGCFDHVVVAADDKRICDAVQGIDVEPVLTRQHRSGTDRVAEVAALARFAAVEIVVNLQGDEPFVAESAVAGSIDRVRAGCGVGTAAGPWAGEDIEDPHTVKVFVDSHGNAAGFSRRATPPKGLADCAVLHHVGIYAYRPAALARWAATGPVAAEIAADLEQLRPLSYGERIGVAATAEPPAMGINTAEDLRRAELIMSVSC